MPNTGKPQTNADQCPTGCNDSPTDPSGAPGGVTRANTPAPAAATRTGRPGKMSAMKLPWHTPGATPWHTLSRRRPAPPQA